MTIKKDQKSRKQELHFLSLFFRGLIILAAVVYTVLIFIDLYSTNDLNSDVSFIYDESVQNEIRTNEVLYRDSLIDISKVFLNSQSEMYIIDSLLKKMTNDQSVKNSLIIEIMEKKFPDNSFSIPLDKPSSLTWIAVQLESIDAKYSVNISVLESIIKSSEKSSISEVLKLGNYLSYNYEFVKKLEIVNVLIIAFAGLVLFSILIYVGSITTHTSEKTLEEESNELDIVKEETESIKEELEEEIKDASRIEKLKENITSLEKKIEKFHPAKILDTNFRTEVTKSEKKSNDLYNRSTIMLILGLLVASLGVAIFYFTIPEYDPEMSNSNFILLAIRPALILLFIQSISIYLLRQYRLLIGDYKYFHKIYLEKSRVFSIYQTSQNEEFIANEEEFVKFIKKNIINLEMKTNSDTDVELKNLDINNILNTLSELIKKIK
jgi:hypothetical protein